jgi:hypothetical protein
MRVFCFCDLSIVSLTPHALQVAHVIDPEQEHQHNGAPNFHLVEAEKTAKMEWRGDCSLAAYSCMRCPLLVVGNYGNFGWRGLDAIKGHVNQE